MCRNIRTLHNFDPPATEEEVRASALQYVRKVSGSTKPSQANEEAFNRAVDEVADVTSRLLDALVTTRRRRTARWRRRSCASAPRSATPPPESPLLEGIRVVEFATLIAGPFCGLTLSDLGADVVKVEPRRGDEGRSFLPFGENGESAFFHALNRGKRSVVVERRRRAPAGRAGGCGDRERAGPARLRPADMPERLVWCSITGHGVGRGVRAMDPSLQATMGLMELTGERDGPPCACPCR